ALNGEALPQELVIAAQQLCDLVERQLEAAETANRNRVASLLERIPAVTRDLVDLRGPQQAQLVVVAKRLRRQPGQLREPPDREELLVPDSHWWKHEASRSGKVKSRSQSRNGGAGSAGSLSTRCASSTVRSHS